MYLKQTGSLLLRSEDRVKGKYSNSELKLNTSHLIASCKHVSIMSTFPLFKKCTEKCRIKCESMNPHTPSPSPGPHSITRNPGCVSFLPTSSHFIFSYGGNAWLLAQWSALLPYAVFQKAFHISTLVPLILNCLYPFHTWKDFSRGRLAKALVLSVIGFHYSYLWQYILPIFSWIIYPFVTDL